VEDWKIKISVLWLFVDIAYLTDLILGFMEPGGIAAISSGVVLGMTIGPELLFVVAIALVVPLVMAFLSLVLKNTANRWANVVVGIVYVVFWILAFIELLVQHPVAYSLLITLSKLVASAVIVWYAWESKQKT
jgi:hypothetical protein